MKKREGDYGNAWHRGCRDTYQAISLNPEAAVEVTADNGKEGLKKNLLSCFFKIHAPKELR